MISPFMIHGRRHCAFEVSPCTILKACNWALCFSWASCILPCSAFSLSRRTYFRALQMPDCDSAGC